MAPTIVALGGGGFLMEADKRLDDYVLGLSGKPRPKVCFVPTASGDATHQIARFYEFVPPSRASASHLALFRRSETDLKTFVLEQDVVYVSGGSTSNLLAIWKLHGLGKMLRDAWEAGVILAGPSAGAICWFEGGLTDSFGPSLTPIGNGLGFLPGSFCPHYSNEPARKGALRTHMLSGALPTGYAADDGAAIRFEGTAIVEAVTTRDSARAYRVEAKNGSFAEVALPARML